jgi:nucleotide-binding universal stress UspA family protein
MRILCASDGSPRAAAAVDKLCGTFLPERVAVDLLAVAAPRRGSPTGSAARERAARFEEQITAEERRLAGAGFAVDRSLRAGHPADQIVAFAEATGPDLIVLGSRSADGDGSGYSGRVAGSVARHAHVPVLIARDAVPIRSIVLGYDESPDADRALSLVAGLPWRSAPEVAVCSAYEVGETLLPGMQGAGDGGGSAARVEDLVESRYAAEGIAGEAAARLTRAGIPATGHAPHGRASAQLEILAAQLAADLIVVGSRGISGVERFLLGSTSDELVVSARTSILVVRS